MGIFSFLKFYFRNLRDIITTGRIKTPREKLFDKAESKGFSIHKIPERYKGKRKYRKAPRIQS